MAKKGGSGALLFVAIFLGLVAAGGVGGLFYFYNQYDALLREEKPAWEQEAAKQKKAAEKAVARWNELAPWVLDTRFEKPEDFDQNEGREEVKNQVVKPILAHLGRENWKGLEFEAQRDYARNEKLRIGDVIRKLDERIASLEEQIKSFKGLNDKLNGDLRSAREAAQAQEQALQARINGQNAENTRLSEQLMEVNRSLTAAQNKSREDLKAARDEATQQHQADNVEIGKLRNDAERLKEELGKITEVKNRKEVVLEADGEITGVALNLDLAYINLGRHQRVQRGMVFTVFTMDRGGIPRPKGKIEIRNVEDDASKVGILSQASRRDPIVTGDFIANPVYRMDAAPVFVICGELERYSREDMKRLIEENGGKVDGKVSPRTDFVVAAGDTVKYQGESLANYHEALQLGLRMMNEKELLQYLPFYGEN